MHGNKCVFPKTVLNFTSTVSLLIRICWLDFAGDHSGLCCTLHSKKQSQKRGRECHNTCYHSGNEEGGNKATRVSETDGWEDTGTCFC